MTTDKTEIETWAREVALRALKSIMLNARQYMQTGDTNDDRRRFEVLHHKADKAIKDMPKDGQAET